MTVWPGAMSPVHTAPSGPTDRVPELAVSSPLPVASSEIPVESVLTLMPRYGVCPVLARVAVYADDPAGGGGGGAGGEIDGQLGDRHGGGARGPGLAAGQLLPGRRGGDRGGEDLVAGVGVVHRDGVGDGDRPAGRHIPVQDRTGLVKVTVPELATALLP